MSHKLLAALFPPAGVTDADYPAYLRALLAEGEQEEAAKPGKGGWVIVRAGDEPADDEGTELGWQQDPKYRGKQGGKWVGTDEDAGKVRYQKNKPGTRKAASSNAAVAKRRPPNRPPDRVYNVKTDQLTVDPERFQFKLNVDRSGVTEELKKVTTFNPLFAGVLAVWRDPQDGRTYVVNGHHRYELARRLNQPSLSVRYIQARNAQEARAIGALVNIAEGRGTAVDAAKFLRDSGMSVDALEQTGVSLRGKVAADAAVLTRLNERLFGKVVRGLMPESQAMAIASHLDDHDLQDQLMKLVEKRAEAKKPISNAVLEEMAREMAETPVASSQGGLFKDMEFRESLFVERNELKSYLKRILSQEAADFAVVASKRRAEAVAGAGNVLNVEENQIRAEAAEQVQAVFETLVNRKGEISDAINTAAAEWQKARTRKEREAVRQKTLAAVRAAVQRETDGGATAGGPSGGGEPTPGPAGTGADDGGRGDSQPDRLNRALERFDNRGSLRNESGSLFGGDYTRSMERGANLPAGTSVVVGEGQYRGKTGKLARIKSLDGSERVALHLDDGGGTVPVSADAIEPLDDLLSWRTEAGAAPNQQSGLFKTYDPLRKDGREAGTELGWEDAGADPSDNTGRRRKWVGTPPDKGTRKQISKPGTGRKKGQDVTEGTQTAKQETAEKPTAGKSKQPEGKVLYSGAVLQHTSRTQLLAALKDLIPPGWEIKAHHMTMAFGKALPSGQFGKKGLLWVTHVAVDRERGVMAVKVKSNDFQSENATPHITIAVAPGTPPKRSNEITDWQPLPKSIKVFGASRNIRAGEPARAVNEPKPKVLDPTTGKPEPPKKRKGTTRNLPGKEPGVAQVRKSAKEQALQIAKELREAGNVEHANRFEQLAKQYDDAPPPPTVKPVAAKKEAEAEEPEILDPKNPRPLQVPRRDPGVYHTRGKTLQEASGRMRSHLDAHVDRAILRRHGGDLDRGIGTYGPKNQPVYPLGGKLYVVETQPQGGDVVQTLREVQPGTVLFSKKPTNTEEAS